jgi:ferredoxin--NADP+ reductase
MQVAARDGALHAERVTWVHHWTEQLFSMKTTRSPSFRFSSGQFVMMGLDVDGRKLLRAYSIASPPWDDTLEFYSIKIAGGPLTSRLKAVEPGDEVLIGRKPTGTLVLAGLRPGRNLYLISTGTGLAPFLSIVRDPETYERFERVIVTHTCRYEVDLSYRDLLSKGMTDDPCLADLSRGRLLYYPTVTRGPFAHRGRITDLMKSQKMFSDLQIPAIDPAQDRFMLCGRSSFLKEFKSLLEPQEFEEGSVSRPADFVIEKAFVESELEKDMPKAPSGVPA